MKQCILQSRLKNAIDIGDVDLVRDLVNDGADVTADDNYAIGIASKNGYLDVVKYIVEKTGADVTADNNYAVRWASEYGHLSVVKYLVENTDVDVTADDNGAVRWASENGHLPVVKYLVENTDVDATANGAVRWASRYGHLQVVKYLIEKAGADIISMSSFGFTSIARDGHIDVIKYLLGIVKVRQKLSSVTTVSQALVLKRMWKEIVDERVQVARIVKHLGLTSRIPDDVIDEIKKYT